MQSVEKLWAQTNQERQKEISEIYRINQYSRSEVHGSWQINHQEAILELSVCSGSNLMPL